MNLPISEILTYVFGSTTLVSVYVAWTTRKSQISIAKADAVDKVADVYLKLTTQTEKRFSEMDAEIQSVKRELQLYKMQCGKCSNNKIGK